MNLKSRLPTHPITILIFCFFISNTLSEQLYQKDSPSIGIVQGTSIGFDSRIAAGNKTYNQSPYGANLLLLQPTSAKSHLRLTTGVPLFRSRTIKNQVNNNRPDIYTSLDHEWGTEFFGIAAGLSTLYMYGFDTTFLHISETNYSYVENDSVFKYPSSMQYNLMMSIRAGRPYAGFRARVSWPLPYFMDFNNPQNLFFEYSAYGFFGNQKYKVGFGVNGFLKTWGHSLTRESYDYSYNYTYNTEPPESREFQAVVPGTKVAVLIAKHNILTISAELGGIIVPRFGTNWAPELGLTYVFSFGQLRDPSSLDGKF